MKILSFITGVLVLLASCSPTTDPSEKPAAEVPSNNKKSNSKFISEIEKAHAKTEFNSKENVSFDIQLYFGGKERLNGKLTLSADSRNGKIEKKDGSVILFNDGKVFVSPELENTKGARFSAYTWSYFFMFPYKLSDPGTHWENYPNNLLNDLTFDSYKLTFEENIGDAPDDWYIMYTDPENHLINSAAYIVTAGATKEEAEEDPHAIEYCDYLEIDGIPMATTWRFWEWRENKGFTKQLGNAILSNIEFTEVDENFYSPLDSFKEVK